MGKNLISLKKVQGKFLVLIIPAITVILMVLAVILYNYEKGKQIKQIDGFSIQIVDARAHEIEKWINSLIIELQHIARRNIVKTLDWEIAKDELIAIAEEKKETYEFLALAYSDGFYHSTLKGKSEKSIAKMQYFIDVYQNGKDYAISNPYYSITTGSPIFLIIVPIKSDNGEVIGCIAGIINLSTLSKIAADIKIKDGYGWIMDNTGLIMAHKDQERVLKVNLSEASKSGYQHLDNLAQEMFVTQSGSGTFIDPDGIERYLIYSKIPSSPNWTLGISMSTEQVYSDVNFLLKYLLVAFILTVLIIALLIWSITNKAISSPLKNLTSFIKEISQGNLSGTLNLKSEDEIGEMASSLNSMSGRLAEIVMKIKEGSENIAAGSKEVNNSAAQISNGANKQAESVEKVSAIMEEIASNIEQNSTNAQHTEGIAVTVNEKMRKVAQSASEAVEANKKITERISIINEIAFQTNILALNAAVEAARAGEHGKGFAVVASEVRKLAENSKNAADEVVELAAKGLELTQNAGNLLSETIPEIEKTSGLVQEISSASVEQNAGMGQVNSAVHQLSGVSQQNASSSEELSSSAEELDAQASQLNEMIAFFKMR